MFTRSSVLEVESTESVEFHRDLYSPAANAFDYSLESFVLRRMLGFSTREDVCGKAADLDIPHGQIPYMSR